MQDIKNLAIVFCTDFNDFQHLLLLAKTIRHIHNNIPMFVLTYPNVSNGKVQQLKQLNIEIIDASLLLNKKFNFFVKYKQNASYLCINSKKSYPKITFLRLLVPYVKQLQQYKQLLYLDNDMILANPLNELVSSNTTFPIVIPYDGQSKSQPCEMQAYKTQMKYDIFGKLYSQCCPGAILFNMDNIKSNIEEYDASIERISQVQQKIFADVGYFWTDQEMLHLCFDYKLTYGLYVWSGKTPIMPETCLFHYYRLKKNGNIIEKLNAMLASRSGMFQISNLDFAGNIFSNS